MRSTQDKPTVYYDDAAHDDFAGTNIQSRTVDDSFPYLHQSGLWHAVAALLYYGIAVPLVWFYMRVILQVKFVNRDALKATRGQPCFLYGNHTGFIDAFIPNLLSLPHRNHIIVGADTVSIKGLRTIVQMFGALPLPTGQRGMRSFCHAVEVYHQKANITVYPEAHIWPYYTGIRHFSDASFGYPVTHKAPVYAFFTAYTKPRGFLSFCRKANITVYVSNPIYPKEGLSDREARRELRDQVFAFMQDATRHSTYEVIHYRPRSEQKNA